MWWGWWVCLSPALALAAGMVTDTLVTLQDRLVRVVMTSQTDQL